MNPHIELPADWYVNSRDAIQSYVDLAAAELVRSERERCAKIADAGNTGCGDQGDLAALDIAEKIRSGE
jgi:hypothetical protein